MKYITELELQKVRNEVWKHMIECKENASALPISTLLRRHKRVIHMNNLQGRNKYKTLDILKQYLYTDDPISETVFMRTVDRRQSLSSYTS
jgi:hypothetical protein